MLLAHSRFMHTRIHNILRELQQLDNPFRLQKMILPDEKAKSVSPMGLLSKQNALGKDVSRH